MAKSKMDDRDKSLYMVAKKNGVSTTAVMDFFENGRARESSIKAVQKRQGKNFSGDSKKDASCKNCAHAETVELDTLLCMFEAEQLPPDVQFTVSEVEPDKWCENWRAKK